MRLSRAIALVAVILLHATCSLAQLRISEFMAVNTHTLLEGTSNYACNYADWIEIENTGTSVVHASGYFLTDDPRNPGCSRRTTVSISSRGS